MPGKLLERAREDGRNYLFEDESKSLLAAVRIPVVETFCAETEEQAVEMTEQLGYPAALKVRSAAFNHKSDAGGVKLNLANSGEVIKAYRKIMEVARREDPSAAVTVQRMADSGLEVIAGTVVDPHFGPVVMFGAGGILTDILNDRCFRLIPIEKSEAAAMIRSLRISPLLLGYRNYPPLDVKTLEDILTGISRLVEKYPDISELDLNPVAVYKEGAVALDARIKLK